MVTNVPPRRGLGRPFWALLVGQVTSRLGDGIYDIGLLWLVISQTGSGLATGIALVCEELPSLMFPLLGGALADRTNRRQLLFWLDLTRMLLPLALGVAYAQGFFSLPIIYATTFILASVSRLQGPTLQALFPSTTNEEHYRKANSIFRGVEQLARISGPLLGGILVAVAPVAIFYANAASFLIASMFTLIIPRNIGDLPTASDYEHTQANFWDSIGNGLRYVRDQRNLWPLIGLGALLVAGTAPLNVAMPVFVKFTLGLNSSAYGWAAASMGLGMFAGALSAVFLPKTMVKVSLLKWGFLLAGLCFLAIGVFPGFRSLLLLSVVSGTFIMLSAVVGQTIMQSTIPEDYRGRVFAVVELLISAFTPAALLAVGLLLDVWPAEWVITLVASLLVVSALASMWPTRTKEDLRGDLA